MISRIPMRRGLATCSSPLTARMTSVPGFCTPTRSVVRRAASATPENTSANEPRIVKRERKSWPLFYQASENNKGFILEVLKQYIGRRDSIFKQPPQHQYQILEISSGSGQHIGYFFEEFTSICPCTWQPSDWNTSLFPSISHYVAQAQQNLLRTEGRQGLGSTLYKSCVLEPVVIDASLQPWVVDSSNMSYWQEPKKHIANLGAGSGSQDNNHLASQKEVDGNCFFDVVLNVNMIHITPYQCCEGLIYGVGKVLRVGGMFFLYGPFKVAGLFTTPSNQSFDEQLKSRNKSWGVRDVEAIESLAKGAGLKLVECINDTRANNFCLVFQKQ